MLRSSLHCGLIISRFALLECSDKKGSDEFGFGFGLNVGTWVVGLWLVFWNSGLVIVVLVSDSLGLEGSKSIGQGIFESKGLISPRVKLVLEGR